MKYPLYILLQAFLLPVAGICQNAKSIPVTNFGGKAQGTYYAVTYFDCHTRNFHAQVDSLLLRFDSTASTYKPNSIISRINQNIPMVLTDSNFNIIFRKSMEISENTDGAFDITVGPLVNAWGFGYTDRIKVNQHVVDSLLPLVNYHSVHLRGTMVYKDKPGIKLDYNAIAQGYSVDEIGRFLQSKGIGNFVIDVGGEVLARGMKPDGSFWNVGIERPAENAKDAAVLKAVVKLKDKALSTSGNYRHYYIEKGIRYAHTIDPKTGYPVQHSLLSASVLAPDCMTADGYATAFMVMGIERSKAFLAHHPELQVYFIYSGKQGELLTYISPGFQEIIEEQY